MQLWCYHAHDTLQLQPNIMQLWRYHAYNTLQLQPNSGTSAKRVIHTMSMLCRGKEADIFTELG